MTDASVSFAGNLTDNPELRHTEAGIARAMLRVAVSGRREQEASFFTVIVWRDQAEHAAESLAKGSRVVVVGRLQQRAWTAEDGSARSVVEVVAEELGRACGGRRRPRPGRRGTPARACVTARAGTSTPFQAPPSVTSCPRLVLLSAAERGLLEAYTGHECWTGHASGPERRVMNAVVNGLLWFAMFAIPMMIAVMLRRLGRKYGLGDRGDPAQEPDYRRWA
jgi:single-strand DNA-binding protein